MKKRTYQPIFAIIIYLFVCILTTVMIEPFSMVVLLGACAGIASTIIILWGVQQILSIFVASILYGVFVNYYLSIEFDIPIILIAILAICTQGIWARTLTDKLIIKDQWLESRKKLSSFIYKIGPLASLVSAIASILITILSARTFEINLLYVFCQTWSMSLLFSIFSIPILLLLNRNSPMNKSKQLFVVISSILGAFAIALLFKIGHDSNEHYRNDEFHKVQSSISLSLEHQLEHIQQQHNGVRAFFEASREINIDSFNEFSAHILDENSIVESFQWAPVVEHEQRNGFEEYMSSVLDKRYMISQQTIMGNNIKSKQSVLYFPVQYVFPRYQNEQILGIDLLADDDKTNAIKTAIETGKPTATPPLSLVAGDFSDPVILIIYPVYNQSLKPMFGLYEFQGRLSVSGVIVAVVKVSTLLSDIKNLAQENNLNLFISDVNSTSYLTVTGQKLNTSNRLSSENTINFFSRQWIYELSEKNTWVLQEKSWKTWGVLIGGTLGGAIFQLLILMMAAYSTELNNRVTQKTRELILSKEKSDNENQAKTDFLQSLSIELRVPLSVIKRLVEVFPKKKLLDSEKDYIDNISSAALNLEQLMDTLNELTSIESGRLFINIQSFDFKLFLKRMEEIVEAQSNHIKFIIQEDVPQYIESDELRLQQVFITCVENAKDILKNKNICISVKVHFHHQNNATIVFVLHVLRSNDLYEQSIPTLTNHKDKESVKFNLRMEMAKELCNKLGGNINIAELPSGESMIHVSVKVKVSQEQESKLDRFDIPSIEDVEVLKVQRMLFVEGKDRENKNLYRQLISLRYHVDVITDLKEIESKLTENKYHLIVFDCSEKNIEMGAIPTPFKGHHSKIPTIALFNEALDNNMLSVVNYKFSAYVVLPITTENLRGLISNYLN